MQNCGGKPVDKQSSGGLRRYEYGIKMGVREGGCEVDQTGSEACEMVVFNISGVDHSGPATRVNFLMSSIGSNSKYI
jgi:hypothetical protein